MADVPPGGARPRRDAGLVAAGFAVGGEPSGDAWFEVVPGWLAELMRAVGDAARFVDAVHKTVVFAPTFVESPGLAASAYAQRLVEDRFQRLRYELDEAARTMQGLAVGAARREGWDRVWWSQLINEAPPSLLAHGEVENFSVFISDPDYKDPEDRARVRTIEQLVQRVLGSEASGLRVVVDGPPLWGSWYRRKAVAGSKKALKAGKDALVAAAVEAPQAAANRENAEAVAALLDAARQSTHSYISLGQILVVHTTRPDGTTVSGAFRLTHEQQRALEANPGWILEPDCLERLGTFKQIESVEGEEEPPALEA